MLPVRVYHGRPWVAIKAIFSIQHFTINNIKKNFKRNFSGLQESHHFDTDLQDASPFASEFSLSGGGLDGVFNDTFAEDHNVNDFFISSPRNENSEQNRLSTGDDLYDFLGHADHSENPMALGPALGMHGLELSEEDTLALGQDITECIQMLSMNIRKMDFSDAKVSRLGAVAFMQKNAEVSLHAALYKRATAIFNAFFDKNGKLKENWPQYLNRINLTCLSVLLLSGNKFATFEKFIAALMNGPSTSEIFTAELLDVIIYGYYLAALTYKSTRAEKYEKIIDWFLRHDQFSIAPTVRTFGVVLQSCYLVEGKTENLQESLRFVLSRALSNGVHLRDIYLESQFTEDQKTVLERIFSDYDNTSGHSLEVALAQLNMRNIAEDPSAGHDLPPIKLPINWMARSRLAPELQRPIDGGNHIDSMNIAYLQEALKKLKEYSGNLYTFQEALEMDAFQLSVIKTKSEKLITRERQGYIAGIHSSNIINDWATLAAGKLAADRRCLAEADMMIPIEPGFLEFLSLYEAHACMDLTSLMAVAIKELLQFSEFQHELGGFLYHRACTRIFKMVQREMAAFKRISTLWQSRQQNNDKQNNANFSENDGANLVQNDDAMLAETTSPENKIKIGGCLLNYILKTAIYRLDERRHEYVFSHEVVPQKKDKQVVGIVRVHPLVWDLLFTTPEGYFSSVMQLPMLVPPRLWSSFNKGGYLTQSTTAVKVAHQDPVLINFFKLATDYGFMNVPFSALNILGKTPWTIHTDVLAVMIACWNKNIFVSDHLPLEYAEEDVADLFTKEVPVDKAVKRERASLKRKVANNFSIRTTAFFQMETARCFAGRTLYFPHCVDFRGRAYPVPYLLNHLGSDPSRALLVFAEAKPLGTEGLRWLKIHTANVYGNSKIPLEDRVAWVDQNLERILAVAKDAKTLIDADAYDPESTFDFWKSAEKPWQFLSACFELRAALAYAGGPEAYPCRLPIHQDGSCNGLQHYAALGRDPGGARFVNLAPSEKPQDIYTAVAENIKVLLSEQAAKENDDTQSELLLTCKNLVSRKVVKQTIMTGVYGVTLFGAREQVAARLKEIPSVQDTFLKQRGADGEKIVSQMALIIARAAFQSLGSVFNSSRSIQSWLEDISTEVVTSVPTKLALRAGLNTKNDASILLEKIAQVLAVLSQAAKENYSVTTFEQFKKFREDIENGTGSPASSSVHALKLARYNPLKKIGKKAQAKNQKVEARKEAKTEVEKELEKKVKNSPKETENFPENNTENITNNTINMPEFEAENNALDSPTSFDVKLQNVMQMDSSVYPMNLMYWTTPLGFPVSQPYRKEKCVQVLTTLQNVSLAVHNSLNPVLPKRQVAAFPPNFIHSLDASHMMLTALACDEAGLTFASVHDSFWTHAADVSKMNSLLRDAFVKLHASPILENLHEELKNRYEHEYCVPILLPAKLKQYLAQAQLLTDEEIFNLALAYTEYRPNLLGKAEHKSKSRRESEAAAEPDSESQTQSTEAKPEAAEFKAWKRVVISRPPAQGPFEIRRVTQSTYFFN